MSRKNNEQNRLAGLLEKQILYGISLEWQTAADSLRYSEGISLAKPLFALHDASKNLGSWSHPKRLISFSRNFVLNHGWDSVKEVLLHEMAHQLASEFFNAGNKTPHGKTFLKACHLLRANPDASGSYPPLSERINNSETSENDKIMFKIRKLFALAQSSNIHEAESALSKAHKLIHKYNIEMIEENNEREYVSIFLGKPALKRFREEYALANLITMHYFVYGIWIPAYVMETGKTGRVLEISGTVKNIKIAAYVYDFVKGFIDRSWSEYNRDGKHNRHRKTDYATGIINGFKSKLEKNLKKNHSVDQKPDTAPLIIEDPRLTTYTEHRYPHIRSFRRRPSTIDEKIIRDGEKAGRRLVISKGIEGKKGSDVTGLLE